MAVFPSPQTAIRALALASQGGSGPSSAKVYYNPKVGHRLPVGETAPTRPKAFVITNAAEV